MTEFDDKVRPRARRPFLFTRSFHRISPRLVSPLLFPSPIPSSSYGAGSGSFLANHVFNGWAIQATLPRLRVTPDKTKLFGPSHWLHTAEKVCIGVRWRLQGLSESPAGHEGPRVGLTQPSCSGHAEHAPRPKQCAILWSMLISAPSSSFTGLFISHSSGKSIVGSGPSRSRPRRIS